MRVIVAVMLSVLLGPGMGQIYNREYKKGFYLVGVSLIVFMAAIVWLKGMLSPYLPVDLVTADPVALKPTIEQALNEILREKGGIFYTYQFLLIALWIYSVVDAYQVAKRRLPVAQNKEIIS